MSIAQVLMIAWARKWSVIVFTFVTLLAALTALQFLPRRYDATAQIYFRMGERDPATDAELPNIVLRSFLQTQMETIRSRPVALKVVQLLGYDKDPAYRDKFIAIGGKGDIADWIAADLVRSVVVERVGLSDIVSVTYKDHNPKRAAELANAFVTAYIKESINLRAGPALDLMQWYDERLSAFREKTTELNARRFEMRQKAGLVDSGGNETASSDPTTSFANAVGSAQLEVVQAKAALDSIRNSPDQGTETDEVKQLRRQVATADGEIARATRVLGPNHQRVRTLTANWSELQNQLAIALKRGSTEVLGAAQQRVDTAERRLKALRVALDQKDQLASTQATSISSLGALDREADALKAQIATMIERRERLRLQGTVEQTLASRLTQANEPPEPAFPRTPMVLGLALGLGIPFGFAVAFLREMLDRRVRLPQDIATYMDLPLIAVVQIPRGLRSRRRAGNMVFSPPSRAPRLQVTTTLTAR